jgi:hypothetical protein
MKIQSTRLVLCVLALASVTLAALTENFPYVIQVPYDLQQSDRYNHDDGAHHFWVYDTDKPLSASSSTKPRSEMRIKNDYTSGTHTFEADFKVPSGTSGTSIFQIFGGGNGHATSL